MSNDVFAPPQKYELLKPVTGLFGPSWGAALAKVERNTPYTHYLLSTV